MNQSLLNEILSELETVVKKIRDRIQKNNSPGLVFVNDKQVVLDFLEAFLKSELANQGKLLRTLIRQVKPFFFPEKVIGTEPSEIAKYLWEKYSENDQLRELIPHITRGIITHRSVITNVNPDEWLLLSAMIATFAPKFGSERDVKISFDALDARFRPLSRNLMNYYEFFKSVGLELKQGQDGQFYLSVSPELLNIIKMTEKRSNSWYWEFPREIFDVYLYSTWIAKAHGLDDHFVNVLCGLIALFIIFGLLSSHAVFHSAGRNDGDSAKSYVGYLIDRSFLFPMLVPMMKLVAFEILGANWVRRIYPLDRKVVDRLANCYVIFRELCITVNQGIIQANHVILNEIVNNRVGVSSSS